MINAPKTEATDKIHLTIDGKDVEADQGMTVLEAALKAGFYIPRLCYDPDLKPYGACRLCIVEIEKMRGLPTSCTTPVTEGMVIHTESPAVNQSRRITMELIMANHRGDCLTCAKNTHCELQEVARFIGIDEKHFARLRKRQKEVAIDDSNPAYIRDMNKCILCGRCVRACHEITGIDAIDIAYRGDDATISNFGNKPIIDSRCETCGECVTRCPTGALVFRRFPEVTREVKTTCPYCAVGCQMILGIRGGEVVRVRGDKEGPSNKGQLCVKGRFGIVDFVHHKDRIKTPLIKRNGKFEKATWDEALDLVAKKLKTFKSDEVGVISSARSTNEASYLMQKFGRVVLGTNNVDHCARLCHAPTVAGLATTFGSGAMTNNVEDFNNAKLIFAIGTNTAEAYPVLAMKVRQAVRKYGAKLIVANPMEVDFVRDADLWIRHNSGSDVALMMGMCRVILEEGLHDAAFVAERCENFEAFKESLKEYPLDKVAEITGVSPDIIVKAANMYATSGASTILYSMGLCESSHGTDNVIATGNLSMLTGNIGRPGTGVNPLRGQNNVQGACDMGALPNVFSGYQAVAFEGSRQKFELAWDTKLSAVTGLKLSEMLPAAHEGKIKAFYIMGENPVLTDPDVKHTREALSRLDFFVFQDLFINETAEYAHVILPAASFAEKDGTFTNTERRVQRVRKAIEPIGESRDDCWIICELAKRMGAKGFEFPDAASVMDEVARLTPIFAGISYKRLEESGLQWPCTSDDHPGTCIMHEAVFSHPNGKGHFVPLTYRPAVELTDKEYPLILMTYRRLYHYHCTMTRKVDVLNILMPEETLQICPQDAATYNITDGKMAHVTSRQGELDVKAKVTTDVPKGMVAMSFHFAECPTNTLISCQQNTLDPVTKTPAFKNTPVKVIKAAGK